MNKYKNRLFEQYQGNMSSEPVWKTLSTHLPPRQAILGSTMIVFGLVLVGALLVGIGSSQSGVLIESPRLWIWLELLLIPLVLAGALWFSRSTRKNEQLSRHELKLAEWYARHERELEAERFRETAFQAYLDRMSELLLDKGLRRSQPGDEVRNIARARTLTVLRGLDSAHKGILLRFLYDSTLIGQHAVIDLRGADLRGADLKKADLRGACLPGVDLSGADLRGADLAQANLQGAALVVANLHDASLHQANLTSAILTEAVVTGADFSHANLAQADLHEANLEEANLAAANLAAANLRAAIVIEANLSRANLQQASLYRANLTGADLTDANLLKADLSWANLCLANLGGADLPEANLHGANLTSANVIGSSLGAAKSLRAATMPDGRRHS